MDADLDVDMDMCHDEHGTRRDRGRDDLLFAQPDSSCYGECPICFLPMPIDTLKHRIMTCCGNLICNSCTHSHWERQLEKSLKQTCPFCRHLAPTTQAEADANLMRKAESSNPAVLREVGKMHCSKGEYAKAFQYWTKAAGLGDVESHYELSVMYYKGESVETDEKKRVFHLEEAAIAGHPNARFSLGVLEWIDDRTERAMKHFIIAANLGHDESVKELKLGLMKGLVSEEDFAAAIRANQAAVDAMKREAADGKL